MEKICSWCNKKLGQVKADNYSDDVITHGICKQCAHKMIYEKGNSLDAFLNSFNEPILLASGNVEIEKVNKKVAQLINKDESSIYKLPAGNVFDCVNAGLPMGCGKTENCRECLIRNTVEDTYRTGKSQYGKLAKLNRTNGKGVVAFDLLISTEKIDDHVLLRIDKISKTQ